MSRLLVILAVLTSLALPASASENSRVALVFGNSEYRGAPTLPNPVRDAEAVGKKLEGLGFSVTVVTNGDKLQAISAIDSFVEKLYGASIALFYFAGHGIQMDGQNLLLPSDVSVKSARALRRSAIQVQEIVEEMERYADVSLVILDACRNNPFLDVVTRDLPATRSVQVGRGLSPMRLTGRGGIVAYAAAAGRVAADGEGDHSPYTAALLEEIDEPNVEVGLMFRRVAKRVKEATGGAQHPELLVRLVDEVYLNLEDSPIQLARSEASLNAPTSENKEPERPGNMLTTSQVAAIDQLPVGNGISRGASQRARFFGNRVINEPVWSGIASVPDLLGWKSASARSIEEGDDNDSYGTARAIPLAAAIQSRVTPKGDIDWYRISVPSAGELQVMTDDAPENIDLYARVWNADHQVVSDWQGAPRPGGVFDGRYALPKAGDYWIQISDGRSDADSSTPFVLKVDFTVADDPFEPNNSTSSAKPVPSRSVVIATIFPRNDQDWYRVWIPAPGLLSVLAEQVPENLDVAMRIWNRNGDVVRDWAVPSRPGGDTLIEAELANPGVYIVQISDSRNDAASLEPIRFTFDLKPVPDANEPNNSFGKAALVEPTGSHQTAIFPKGDTDWLGFDVDHPGELVMEITGSPENLDIHMRVWNSDKQVLRDWFGPLRMGGDVYGFADLPGPGRYFVEISDGRSDASSPDLFKLDMTFTPEPDQYEPNNKIGQAARLTPGGEILFNILPRGDVDWFQFKVASAGELRVTIDEGPKNLDLHYRVWNDDRQVIRDWVAPYRKGGLTEGFADLPEAGVFYLEVSDGRNDDRSVDHATLKTLFISAVDALEPNNSYGAASPLPLGVPHNAYILPKGDVDWYLLEAPRAGEFVVTVDQVDEALDIWVRMWNSEVQAGTWMGPSRPGGVTDAVIPVAGPGVYRLEVSDGRNDARSARPFRLLAEFR